MLLKRSVTKITLLSLIFSLMILNLSAPKSYGALAPGSPSYSIGIGEYIYLPGTTEKYFKLSNGRFIKEDLDTYPDGESLFKYGYARRVVSIATKEDMDTLTQAERAKGQYYWTSTIDPEDNDFAFVVSPEGTIMSRYTDDNDHKYRIRKTMNLPNNFFHIISGSGTYENPYNVDYISAPTEKTTNNISNDYLNGYIKLSKNAAGEIIMEYDLSAQVFGNTNILDFNLYVDLKNGSSIEESVYQRIGIPNNGREKGFILLGTYNNVNNYELRGEIWRYYGFGMNLVLRSQSYGTGTFNNEPTIEITSPTDIQAFSEVSGHNNIPLIGSINDLDSGDTVLVKYTIDGIADHENKTAATITANGRNQQFSYNIPVDNSIPQGTYTLRVWAEDDKGGFSAQETLTVKIDKTIPNQPSITANTNWTNEASVPVTISPGKDTGGSGVSHTEYSLSGATSKGWTPYSSSFNITNPGETTISARTIDNAGNVSNVAIAVVKIDRTPPGQPTINAETNWTNADSVPVTIFQGTDTGGSGVNHTEYRLTGATSQGWTTYTGGFNISSSGQTTIESRTIDNAGNVSNIAILVVKIDRTPPGQPTINAETNWTNADSVPVTILQSTDNGGSGIKLTEYRLTGATSQGWTTYTGDFNISNQGQTTVEARTVDNAGNVSSTNSVTIKIDRTPPIITGDPDRRDTWDTTAAKIKIMLTDDLSGIQTRQYELTESVSPTGSWSTAGNNNFEVVVNDEGQWYLHINTIDIAGNRAQATLGPYRYFILDSPTGVAAVNPTTNTIDVQWNEVDDHEYKVQIKDDNNVIVAASDWSAKSPYTFNNLKPNTRYTPEIKSRKHGIETNFVSGIAQYTDANPVRTATFEPMDKAIKITLDIAATGNPEGTKYIIKNINTGDTSGQIIQTWTNTDLLNEMDYTYMAKVVHNNGKEGEWLLIGTGHTAITEVIVPWEDLTPINLPDDFDPDTIEGKIVDFNGTPAIVVKGRYINISVENIQNGKKYAISLDGFGYGEWKDLDSSGSFSERIFINQPGLYKVHVKFQNNYGGESKAYVRSYLVDWIKPDIKTINKTKSQTATTDGTFTVSTSGSDNLSPVLYNAAEGWQWYKEGDITATNITLDNTRKDVVFKFSDLNGNVIENTHKIWAINN